MIATLFLKRKDERVIRQVSLIMKDFAARLSEKDLKTMVLLHQKPIELMFHKMSKVSTYYNQAKILHALKTILKVCLIRLI